MIRLSTLLYLGMFLAPSFQTNVVEVYFVVDRQAIFIYEKAGLDFSAAQTQISQDIDYFITEVNSIYNSLNNYGEYGVSIQIAKRKLDLLSYNFFPAGNVDASDGLNTFNAFLSQENSYGTLNYDLALLWTGFELHNKTTGGEEIAGLAHVGTVCQGDKASSIVEFDGTYSTVTTTAHEIGHNLGAGHDSTSSDYVMGPSGNPDDANRWSFSLCTVSDVKSVIDQLSTNCLTTQNAASTVPSVTVTTSLKNPDTICKRAQDDQTSYMCRTADVYDNVVPKGDAVCKSIQCRKTSNTCSSAYASDGLVCGNYKTCNNGKCVSDSSSVAVPDEECIWGDQPEVGSGFSQTCPNFLAGASAINCEQTGFYQACCATCRSRQTGIEGCMYGDRSDQCADYKPTSSFCSLNGHICCKLCHGVSRKRSVDDDEEVDIISPNPLKKMTEHHIDPDSVKKPKIKPGEPPVMS